MRWVLLFAGNVLGGMVSVYYWKNRDSVLLRILSFLLPFSFNTVFWVIQFKSGRLPDAFGISGQGVSSTVTGIVTAVITSFVLALLCKGIGIMIAKYIETK